MAGAAGCTLLAPGPPPTSTPPTPPAAPGGPSGASPAASPPTALADPAAGRPLATRVASGTAPAGEAASPVRAGPPLVVPGRAASPSASPGASPAASPSPLPIALARPGLLVVERDGRILLVDPEGRQSPRSLAADPDNRAPRWSPDGRSVLVVTGFGPAAELRLIAVASGEARRLTGNSRPERGAAWSPRGERIAYTLPRRLGPGGRDDPTEPEEVWVLDLGSGAARRLLDGLDPCWSPDGRWIAYATNGERDRHGPRGNAIRVVGADGQGDREVLRVAGLPPDLLPSFGLPFRPGTVRLRAPAWSPDGLWLAASADGHTSFGLTFDLRGEQLRLWAPAYEGGVGRVRWSPDGSRLAVESRPATGVDVVVVASVRDRRDVVIGGPAIGFQASDPAWSPDGRQLAVVAATLPGRRGEPRETALRVFTPDGSQIGDVVAAPGLATPDWGRAP